MWISSIISTVIITFETLVRHVQNNENRKVVIFWNCLISNGEFFFSLDPVDRSRPKQVIFWKTSGRPEPRPTNSWRSTPPLAAAAGKRPARLHSAHPSLPGSRTIKRSQVNIAIRNELLLIFFFPSPIWIFLHNFWFLSLRDLLFPSY